MKIARAALAAVAVLVVASCASSTAGAQREPLAVNAYGAAVKAFRDRADAYLTLQKKAAETVPPLKQTDDPTKLNSREVALAEAIRQLRVGAKPGDLFGADLTPHIRKVISKDWAQRSVADRAGLSEDIPRNSVTEVNATYPPALPLGTFPASLLAALPPLPEQLEYRFVGRHLILRDVNANLVVDIMLNVIPGGRT